MERKVGQKITYSFKTENRDTVKVQAEIIQIYPGLDAKNKGTDVMSIKYEDLGDTIIEHCIDLNSPAIVE